MSDRVPPHRDRHQGPTRRRAAPLPVAAVAHAAELANGVALVVTSADGIGFVNHTFEEVTEFTTDELLGRDPLSLVHPDHQEHFEALLRRHLDRRAAASDGDIVLVSKGGRLVWTTFAARAIQHAGELLIVLTFVEQRERRQLERALQDSRTAYRQIFDEDVRGRLVLSPTGRVIDVNGTLAKMLGAASPDALVGRGIAEVCGQIGPWGDVLHAVREKGETAPMAIAVPGPDDATAQLSVRFSGGFDPAGNLVWVGAAFDDASALAQPLDTRMLGALRMEAVGRLAGGLAHEFNNLLMVIAGHGERLADALPVDAALRHSATAIQQAAARATSLTQQLLAFSRRQIFELRVFGLDRLIDEAQPLLAKVAGEHIRLRVEVADTLPSVKADPTQIENVLVNLVLNAREAMPEGGDLRIQVDATDVAGGPPADRPWLRAGHYVRLVVADTGRGMDPDTQAHVFEPFFTTKKMGQGAGLGLATAYGIVKQSNGYIWVESTAGRGTRFTVLLPVFDAAVVTETASGRATGGEQSVMVVEPDERVRTFMVDALRRRGYRVLDVASAQAAMEMFPALPERIHLLIADAGGDVGGASLAERLQAVDPALLVLLTGAPVTFPAAVEASSTPLIRKPFSLQALGDKVKSMLDAAVEDHERRPRDARAR